MKWFVSFHETRPAQTLSELKKAAEELNAYLTHLMDVDIDVENCFEEWSELGTYWADPFSAGIFADQILAMHPEAHLFVSCEPDMPDNNLYHAYWMGADSFRIVYEDTTAQACAKLPEDVKW